mmetsp:Transcript_9361/g.33133  ORF Transcript_9361/g.33133 Transcript_9361/m.33133 type:complete len:335 (+) Transcript_9361:847-1851(+)
MLGQEVGQWGVVGAQKLVHSVCLLGSTDVVHDGVLHLGHELREVPVSICLSIRQLDNAVASHHEDQQRGHLTGAPDKLRAAPGVRHSDGDDCIHEVWPHHEGLPSPRNSGIRLDLGPQRSLRGACEHAAVELSVSLAPPDEALRILHVRARATDQRPPKPRPQRRIWATMSKCDSPGSFHITGLQRDPQLRRDPLLNATPPLSLCSSSIHGDDDSIQGTLSTCWHPSLRPLHGCTGVERAGQPGHCCRGRQGVLRTQSCPKVDGTVACVAVGDALDIRHLLVDASPLIKTNQCCPKSCLVCITRRVLGGGLLVCGSGGRRGNISRSRRGSSKTG